MDASAATRMRKMAFLNLIYIFLNSIFIHSFPLFSQPYRITPLFFRDEEESVGGDDDDLGDGDAEEEE